MGFRSMEELWFRREGRGWERDRAHVDVYMAHRVTFEDFL